MSNVTEGRLRSRFALPAWAAWACVLGASSLVAAACAPRATATRPNASTRSTGSSDPARGPAPSPSAGPGALPEGAADVAALRGLAFKRPLTVEHVSRARFKKVLASLASPEPGRVEVMKAFGFVGLDAVVSDSADVRLQAEQLVALYDFHSRAVYVREPLPGTPPAARDSDDLTIAHELTHALQDDHYPLAVLEEPIDADERLARRAVYEGDAIVTSALVVAKHSGKSDEDTFDDVSTEAAAGAVARNAFVDRHAAPLLARTSTLVRAELSFVYDAGATFMARVYETGGAKLANGVLTTLPTTTEQVLHPEKYAAGEQAIELPAPPAPPGFEIVRSGRMGELATSALLRETLPLEVALPAARGWGGDAYSVVRETSTGRLAVLWSTAWDDAGSATRFADALARATTCVPPAPCEALGPAHQQRLGARVAWVRGIDNGEALLDGLNATPARAARRKAPLKGVTAFATHTRSKGIAPPVAGADGRVTLAGAGIRCRVPAGFHASPTRSLDLMINADREPGVAGSLATYDEPYDEEHVAQLRAYFASAFSAGFDADARLLPEAPKEIATPLGKGTEHRWGVEGTPVRLSVLALPRCGGSAMMFVARVTRSPSSRSALDTWLASFEDTADAAASTLCKKAHTSAPATP